VYFFFGPVIPADVVEIVVLTDDGPDPDLPVGGIGKPDDSLVNTHQTNSTRRGLRRAPNPAPMLCGALA
jgi:hypothetical protein